MTFGIFTGNVTIQTCKITMRVFLRVCATATLAGFLKGCNTIGVTTFFNVVAWRGTADTFGSVAIQLPSGTCCDVTMTRGCVYFGTVCFCTITHRTTNIGCVFTKQPGTRRTGLGTTLARVFCVQNISFGVQTIGCQTATVKMGFAKQSGSRGTFLCTTLTGHCIDGLTVNIGAMWDITAHTGGFVLFVAIQPCCCTSFSTTFALV